MLKPEKIIAITSLAIAMMILPRDLFAQLPPGQVFADVPQSDTGYAATLALFQLGISVGCDSTPDFCPGQTLIRQDMAAFIVKAWSARLYNNSTAFTPANQTPYFSDVPLGAPQFQFVQKLYELGITGGVQVPTYLNGVLTPGLYAPSSTLSNYQIAVFLSRARALADNGCATAYFTVAKPFTVSTNPDCSPNNFPSGTLPDNTPEMPYFSDVCSPTDYFPNCAVNPIQGYNPNERYYSFIQRLGDLSVFQAPSTVIGYPGCAACVFNENELILRRQMAIWTVQGMGLQPESVLSMNSPGVSGGPNAYSVLPTITVQFTFTLNNQTATAGQPPPVTEYGSFVLARTSTNSFDNAPLYCNGAYAEADLKLFDGTPTNEVFAYNQPLADSGCTVSLVSVGPATGGTPGKVAVLNFTFTPAVPSGQYNVFHEVTYSVGADPWENVGTLTVQTPPQLSPAPTVTLTDTTQASGYYFAGDSYTATVTGPTTPANLPVSLTKDGVNYGIQGSLDGSGNFAAAGGFATAEIGNHVSTWYVGGAQAGQPLIYSVFSKTTVGPTGNPNSFNAPPDVPICNDLTGNWIATDTTSRSNGSEIDMVPNGTGWTGMIFFSSITGCSVQSMDASGQLNPDGTFTVKGSQPNRYDNCGSKVATSITLNFSLSGNSCSSGVGTAESDITPNPVRVSLATKKKANTSTPTNTPPSPHYLVQYAAYIPVDNIPGPRPCLYLGLPNLNFAPGLYFPTYEGDAYRYTYRVSQSVLLIPGAQHNYPIFVNAGPTRNYGAGAPSGPPDSSGFPTLASVAPPDRYEGIYAGNDEDQIPDDCYKWNKKGRAKTTGMGPDQMSLVYGTPQSVANFSGASKNPLELQLLTPPITWNLRVTIDESTPGSPKAFVTGIHTCYPAHNLKFNNFLVYDSQARYGMPRENTTQYLAECLTGRKPQVSVNIGPIAIPQ